MPLVNTKIYFKVITATTAGVIGCSILLTSLAAQTSPLLPDKTAMQEGFLGFMDPMDWDFVVGDFGVYYMHGGDWTHSSEELHSCVVAFPITVEASLVINSARGAMPYQCSVLRSAFDDAWVAK